LALTLVGRGCFPPDSPPAAARPCSNRSSLLPPAPTSRRRARGTCGLSLSPPACLFAAGAAELSRFSCGEFPDVPWSPTAPGSPAACDSATVDMAFPFYRQGRHPKRRISRLNRQPASSSVNASPAMSPSPAHDSRSAWFATPSLWGSFIPYSPPVYPGAFRQARHYFVALARRARRTVRVRLRSSSGARLVLTRLSRTSPRHAVRKAG
jgi:hypothetical protein